MSKLFLLRHGAAVGHGTPGFADDDRPLTTKGIKRIKELAEGLKSLGVEPSSIVSSPLPRALRTAEIVASTLCLNDQLHIDDALRAQRSMASVRDWLETRSEESLMLVGHDPWISDLASWMVTGNDSGDEASHCISLRKGGLAAFVKVEIPKGPRYRLEWLI